jgi:hypothetical protein
MQKLPLVAALYVEIDASFESQRSDARAKGDNNAVQQIESKQVINDQAYFVLCWGQLEAEIDDRCRAAIRSRVGSGKNWATRRAWDMFNPNDKRLSGLSFEDRTGLLLDRAGGRGSPWAWVMKYYAIRNEIAHGKLGSQRIDVTAVVQDLYLIQSALQN